MLSLFCTTELYLIIGILGLVIVIYYYKIRSIRQQSDLTKCTSENCIRCDKRRTYLAAAKLNWQKYILSNNITNTSRIKSLFDIQESDDHIKSYLSIISGLVSRVNWTNNILRYSEDILLLESNYENILNECREVYYYYEHQWQRNVTSKGEWRTFYFYNQGSLIKKNIDLCPITFKILTKLKNSITESSYGNALFSVLLPGTTIDGHYGSCNFRIRCHLGMPFVYVRPIKNRVTIYLKIWLKLEAFFFTIMHFYKANKVDL